MKDRFLNNSLRECLAHSPAVVLLGARQVGKTTLAKAVSQDMNAIYLDLESPEDVLKISDARAYFSAHSDKLIILDEVQRQPDLFMTLRGVIDSNREKGRRTGQFLLLGSASMDLMRQSSESLAGRIKHLEMSGFNMFEVLEDEQNQLWLRGGFPESFLAESDHWAMDWLEDLIRTYLERDIPQMGFRYPADRLRRLWTMLAHLQGETVNTSKLAMNIDVDPKVVRHNIDLLVDLLLVRRLDPWYENAKKRLVKSPRYYVRDSGILHRLLGIHTYDDLLSHPVLGKSWEGFVIENILSILPKYAEAYFYRTAAGAELDLVLRFSSQDVWAIEIKHGLTPKLSKHFHQTCADVGASKKMVIYGGDDCFSLGKEVEVMSLKHGMHELQKKDDKNPELGLLK